MHKSLRGPPSAEYAARDSPRKTPEESDKIQVFAAVQHQNPKLDKTLHLLSGIFLYSYMWCF